MRSLVLTFYFLVFGVVNGQFIINPDFEDPDCWPSGAGWSGSGCWSLVDESHDCHAMFFDELSDWNNCHPWAELFGIQPDIPYVLSFWVKRTSDLTEGLVQVHAYAPGYQPDMGVAPDHVAVIPLSAAPVNVWTPMTIPFTLPGLFADDGMYVLPQPTNFNGGLPGIVAFDDFAIDEFSTGVAPISSVPLRHRPDPATDKLWIDLAEAPLAITVTDALGRSIPVRTFHHNGRTVEVDVSSVPPGVCVMLMNLTSGIRTVRFIKA